MMNRLILPATLLALVVGATPLLATTVGFENVVVNSMGNPVNNADIPFDYGSFIAGNSTGFITTDGTGATPNIGLSWLGNRPNEWEYHTAAAWDNYKTPVHVAQIDHNVEGGPGTFDNVTEIIFSPINDRTVKINSFVLIGSDNQNDTAIYDWEVVGTGASGTANVPVDGNVSVPVNFTGTPGIEYTLRFTHDPTPSDNNIGTALDDLSFSEVLDPAAQVLKLTVDRVTGGITLANVGSNAANIKGYSITSDVGALETSGWRSIADVYDASGNGSVDGDDNWTELSAPNSGTDLSEFEFGGNGGTIAAGASVVLNTPGGAAWGKSLIEDLELNVTMTDGRVNQYSVEYINGPAGGFEVGDLNFDGDINGLDWPIYHSGRGAELSNLTQAQAYRLGDLDGDLDNDISDFVLFKQNFESVNGVGSLEAFLAVPEPASVVLLAMCFALLLGYANKQLASNSRTVAVLARKTSALLALTITLIGAQSSLGTTLTFADSPGNNQNLPGNYGSNVAVDSAAFVTSDGTGATPNIALNWTPVDPPFDNVLEFHSGPAFVNAGFDVPVLQLDVNQNSHPAPTVEFTVTDGFALNLRSFVINNAADQTEPPYSWDISLIRKSDLQTVASRTTSLLSATSPLETVTFDFIGDPNEDYQLVFDDGGANTVRTAIDNLSFSQVLVEPPALTLQVNTGNGALSIMNDSGSSFDIDSYEILSASQSLDPSAWNSLQQQDFEGAGAPNNGNGWEEAGGSGPHQLIESYLLGSSTIASGVTPISLGNGYDHDKAGVQQDLQFLYHEAGTGGILRVGQVEYIDLGLLFGDADNDGAVAGSDLLAVTNNFGSTGPATGLLLGDADDDGAVAGSDLLAVTNNFGNTLGSGSLQERAVPEPTTLALTGLALTGLAVFVRRRKMSGNTPRSIQGVYMPRQSALLKAILFVAIVVLTQPAIADRTTDRLYQFGDDSSESATAGGAIAQTLDSKADVNGSFNANAQNNLEQSNSGSRPTYVNVGASGLARPGAVAGELGATFDGTNDVLFGARLNRPDESAGPSFIGLGPSMFNYPFNYDEITARGLQMWVYPDAAALGNGRQGIVHDTIAAGGVSITADGLWTQTNDSKLLDGQIPATVPVVGDQWHHVMQHIYRTGDLDHPTVVPGGLWGDIGFTSVVYVNGVAVSVNNGVPLPGEADNPNSTPRIAVLAIGAEELPTENFVDPEFHNHFQGTIDDLEMYVYGDNSSVTTSPSGQDYGTFRLLADNDWIADQIAAIPGGELKLGDVNFDGVVDEGDVDAFVAGWNKEKILQASLNEFAIGDWETLGWGDLNLDGRVDLVDAVALDQALTANGAAGLDFSRLGTSVPEPTTLMLVVVGAVLILSGRRICFH